MKWTIDNVFIEHLWRTLKYDNIYPTSAENGITCRADIAAYCRYYVEERPLYSLNHFTPDEVSCKSRINQRVA